MTHLAEGRLLELRDGADDAQAAAHLRECADCRSELEELGTRRNDIAQALSTLDETWNLEAVRGRVRARVRAEGADVPPSLGTRGPLLMPEGATRRPRSGWGWGLGRAAGLVLVTAAAAYAMPGLPVRGWVDRAVAAVRSGETYVTPPASAPDMEPVPTEATGVRLDVRTGALRVVLRGVASGTEVQVRWVPGTESTVFAPVGSRFTSAEGRIEAQVTPGPVGVDLPQGVASVVFQVEDRTYLEKSDAGIDVRGPTLSRSKSGLVFLIPQP